MEKISPCLNNLLRQKYLLFLVNLKRSGLVLSLSVVVESIRMDV